MSLLIPHKLSNLQIDTDKDWQAKAISNPGNVDGVDVSGHVVDLDIHTLNSNEIARVGAGIYHPSPFMAEGYWESTLTLVADRLYAMLFYTARPRTPATLWVDVQTADAVNSNLRIGLYNDNGNLYPGTRLTNGGVVSVALIGIKTVAYITQITKKYFWVVIIADGVPKLYKTANAIARLGMTAHGANNPATWIKDDTYGNLPDPFPAGASQDISIVSIGMEWASND